ncbi:MAG: ABC transporter permease [Chloroflexota bacterium]|nr:ABC transporter permease [Chloroflexota bacterium]
MAFQQLVGVRTTLIGLVIIVGLALVAVSAPLLTPYDPVKLQMRDRFQPPSLSHPFGTDEFGRDALTRVVYGTRISFRIAVVAVLVATVLGVTIGLVSAYFGGWIDLLLQRVVDVMLAFPGLLLALAVVAALGPSMTNVMLAVGVGSTPFFSRMVRGSVLTVRNEEYVTAATVIGANDILIIRRHILPNVLSPIVVLISQQVGWAVLSAAALSFVGLGAQPPTPEWGAMLSRGRDYLHEQWWIPTFPGLAIALMVLGFNLFGDGLRDILDPKTVTKQ